MMRLKRNSHSFISGGSAKGYKPDVKTYQKYRCVYLLSKQSHFWKSIQQGSRGIAQEHRCFQILDFQKKKQIMDKGYFIAKSEDKKTTHSPHPFTPIIKCSQSWSTHALISPTSKEKLHSIFRAIHLQATFYDCCYFIL